MVLTHGAGQGINSPFMRTFGDGICARGLDVIQFEFDYMRIAMATKKRHPPDREPKLLATWREVIARVRARFPGRRMLIGGKSMGGRMASLVADELANEFGVHGLVCLGYPFHPPGKPERLRTAHLEGISTPTLICQGERDPLGRQDEVSAYLLSKSVDLVWLADGDHGFKPRRASGFDEATHHATAMDRLVVFALDQAG